MQTGSPIQKTQNTLSIYCDGGARGNPGPGAIGFVVKDSTKKTIHREAHVIGEATNNIAEYKAVIVALEWIIRNTKAEKPRQINFFIDSRLVANQLSGKFRVKDEKLRTLIITVRELERKAGLALSTEPGLFSNGQTSVAYTPIPREMNWEADNLVNQALDNVSPLNR